MYVSFEHLKCMLCIFHRYTFVCSCMSTLMSGGVFLLCVWIRFACVVLAQAAACEGVLDANEAEFIGDMSPFNGGAVCFSLTRPTHPLQRTSK